MYTTSYLSAVIASISGGSLENTTTWGDFARTFVRLSYLGEKMGSSGRCNFFAEDKVGDVEGVEEGDVIVRIIIWREAPVTGLGVSHDMIVSECEKGKKKDVS